MTASHTKATQAPTLDASLRNLCAPELVMTPEAAGLTRTAMIQPGVCYTFDAPLVRILAVYSNLLDDPVIIPPRAALAPS